MASYVDLKADWATLCQECPECWSASGEFLFFFILSMGLLRGNIYEASYIYLRGFENCWVVETSVIVLISGHFIYLKCLL